MESCGSNGGLRKRAQVGKEERSPHRSLVIVVRLTCGKVVKHGKLEDAPVLAWATPCESNQLWCRRIHGDAWNDYVAELQPPAQRHTVDALAIEKALLKQSVKVGHRRSRCVAQQKVL